MGPAVALGQVGVPEEEGRDADEVGDWLGALTACHFQILTKFQIKPCSFVSNPLLLLLVQAGEVWQYSVPF